MKTQHIANWLQILGNLGLLVGVFLVVVQIQQNSELVSEQIYQQRYSDRFAWYDTMMGENPAEIVEKSILRPTELTLSEHIVMDAYLRRYYEYQLLIKELGDRGMEKPGLWRAVVDPLPSGPHPRLKKYFGNEYAAYWLAERYTHFPDGEFIQTYIDSVDELPSSASVDQYEFISSRLQDYD